jgi:hypothetical protein
MLQNPRLLQEVGDLSIQSQIGLDDISVAILAILAHKDKLQTPDRVDLLM